jgi:IS5 family transposase
MGEKRIGDGSFADAFMASGVGRNVRLDRIDGLFNWSRFKKLLKPLRSSQGRKGYPALMMFKALLLQQWYGLSDPGLEEALLDRLSFRRFCGFTLEDATPDETTFVRFRAALTERGLAEKVFDEVARQLEQQGLILKTGTLIDASLVTASVSKPSGKAGAGSELDPDARWTKQYGRSTFGYKAHIAVDQFSCLIRKAELTPANIYESLVADSLIMGDEKAVYGDKGYEHKERRKRLKAQGIKDRIMHRSHKNQDGLPHWQQVRNRLIIPLRASVEKLFGTMKRSYGYDRMRYRGLARNASHLQLLCIAMNMRRAEVLTS